MLLKGIGNVGVTSKGFLNTIKQRIIDHNVPNDVRLQAISAHRRLDCMASRYKKQQLYWNVCMGILWIECSTFLYLSEYDIESIYSILVEML